MQNIQSMLQETCQGLADFKAEILEQIRAFPKIVLRGAGSRGREVYRLLWESIGIEKQSMCYWDIHAETNHEYHEIPVLPLFSGDFDPQKTLVIHCIGSLVLYNADEYADQGYAESLDGNMIFALYEHFFCPYYKGIGKDLRLCQHNSRCEFFACEKTDPKSWQRAPSNLMEYHEALIINDLGLHVNAHCTLKCKYCCEYMNHYPIEDRINFPLERIKRDIDLIADSCDFIREMCLQGGEFFLHPDSAEIISYALSREKIGIVSALSNGICKISNADLSVMNHERFILRISDYREHLDDKQKNLFERNVKKLAEQGICYLFNRMYWQIPPHMRKKGHSEQKKRENHVHCFYETSMRGRIVKNGAYYPCQRSRELTVHHVIDYPDNYLVLDAVNSREARKSRIIALNEREFYPSCDHCDWTSPNVSPGEQGFETNYQYLGPDVHSVKFYY